MLKVKHITIVLDSENESGALPDHLERPNINLKKSREEVELPRIKENPRSMSLETSFSSGEDSPHGGVGEREINTDENPGASMAPIAGEDENSDGSSSKESQPIKKAKTSHKIEAESWIVKPPRRYVTLYSKCFKVGVRLHSNYILLRFWEN